MNTTCVNGELCDNRCVRVAKTHYDTGGERVVIPCDCLPVHMRPSFGDRLALLRAVNKRHRKN